MDLALTVKCEANSGTEDETSTRCSENIDVEVNRQLKMDIGETEIKEELPTMDRETMTNIDRSSQYSKFGIVDHSCSSMDLPDLVKVEEETYNSADADAHHCEILNNEINQRLKVEIGDTEVKSELPATTVDSTTACDGSSKSDKPIILNGTHFSRFNFPTLFEPEAQSYSKQHTCMLCSYAASHPTHLFKHLRTHMGDNKPYKCAICPYSARLVDDFKLHVITSHAGQEQYACNVFHYGSTNSKVVNIHLRNDTVEKPCKCRLCGYTTKYYSTFKKHVASHFKVKPFKCSLCPYSGKYPGILQIHMKTHTSDKLDKCSTGRFKDMPQK